MNKVKIIDSSPSETKIFIDDVEIQGIVRYQISNGVNEPRVLKLEMLVDDAEVETVDKTKIMAKEFAKYAREFNRKFTVSVV